MSIKAVQAFRKMPGGAQSQLMLCSDANLWVVKFRNNPQDPNVLAKELIASRVARSLGLSVPLCDIVEVGDDIIANSEEMWIERCHDTRERCTPGLNFGSQFVGGLMPGYVVDWLPAAVVRDVVNLSEFAGALVMDIWLCNTDFRQVVFRRACHGQKYRAFFIDHGHCLNFDKRKDVIPLRGFYRQPEVYENVRNWDSFQPWVERLRMFDAALLWGLVAQVPLEWGFGKQEDLKVMVHDLLDRAGHISSLLSSFINSKPEMFSKFGIR